MKRFWVFLAITLLSTTAYAASDLACYAIYEPSGGYLQAESTIVPKLGIANLSDQGVSNALVRFIAVRIEDQDTVFRDSVVVGYIGPYPASKEVELDEWTPEGICRPLQAGLPEVEYELLGITCLAEDYNPDNDTMQKGLACLWSHDVGVSDFQIDPPPDPGQHLCYKAYDELTFTATVENFGYHEEHHVVVRCEVRNPDEGDIIVWHNLQEAPFVDWRGNPMGNPYTTEVTFPVFSLPYDMREAKWEVRTELEIDSCPDDDFMGYDCWIGVEEAKRVPSSFALEVSPASSAKGEYAVRFAVPRTSWVKMDVYDVNGKWVRTLANDIYQEGQHELLWHSRDYRGTELAPGVYFVKMGAGDFRATRKVVLVD